MANNHLGKHSQCNFVLKDGVIKEQVEEEYKTSTRWDDKWAFMKDVNKHCLEIAREKGISEEEYKRMTTKRRAPKLPAVSTWDPVSSGPMPRTTTGEIGWRSSKLHASLEVMGPLYISPRHTIDPPGTDSTQRYHSIFLG